MAVIDSQMLLGDDIALPATATSEYSDEIDFGLGKDAFHTARANPNIGLGGPVYFNFVMTDGGSDTTNSPTLTLDIVGGTATAPTTVIQTVCTAVTAATLVDGYKFCVALQSFPTHLRFLRLKVTANSYGFSTGTYTAWISPFPLASA